MKEDKKNIDRLFQEKFRDFEASPSEKNWDQIRKKLIEEKDSRKRLFPIWFKIGSVAAVLLVLFMIGNFWFNTNQNPAVVNQEEIESLEQTQESISESSSDDEKIDKTTQNFKEDNIEYNNKSNQNIVSSNKEDLSSDPTKEKNKEQLTPIREENDKQNRTNDLAKTESAEQDQIEKEDINQEIDLLDFLNSTKNHVKSNLNFNEEGIVQSRNLDQEIIVENSELKESEGKSLFDEISKQEEIDQDDQSLKSLKNRFAVRPNVAPIYYNSMKGGSAVDPSLAGNKSEGEVTMSYGVNVSYAVSSRVKVRTGVSKVNMSYSTPDIAFIFSPNRGLQNLNRNPQAKDILVVRRDGVSIIPNEISENSAAPYTFGKLNQQLEYIEVPVEVEFTVLDKKFGINVIGGASTLFLKDDVVRINSEMGSTDLGRASNLNSVSFTTNIGVGFDYNLTETLNFNIEPTFKYQVNGFSGDSGGFKPYYFGVYSGVSVRF